LKAPVETLKNPESLVKQIEANLDLKAGQFSFRQSGRAFHFPKLNITANKTGRNLQHKILFSAWGGHFALEGLLNMTQATQNMADAILDSNLKVEGVHFRELKKWVPEKYAWFPSSGQLDGSVHVKGPVIRPEKIQANGKLHLKGVTTQLEDIPLAVADIREY